MHTYAVMYESVSHILLREQFVSLYVISFHLYSFSAR